MRVTALCWLFASLGACAAGVGGETMEIGPTWDASSTPRNDAGNGSSDAAAPHDATILDAHVAHDATTSSDASQADAASGDANTPLQEAGAEPSEAGADTSIEDASTPNDAGGGVDTGGDIEPDAGPADSGAPDAPPPAPVNCAPIARTGVQLCDMGADFCGAVFSNSSGCTVTCAAASLVCAMAYENVENQCARDDTRPAITCDSGHMSDYCLCKRP